MLGILYCVAEFLEDRTITLFLLTLIWCCELFNSLRFLFLQLFIISVRSLPTIRFFPRFFFLYLMIFLVYYFSFPFGFSYLAFFTMAAFMQHLVLYFFNRFEIPAVLSGRITHNSPRAGLIRRNVVFRRMPRGNPLNRNANPVNQNNLNVPNPQPTGIPVSPPATSLQPSSNSERDTSNSQPSS